MREQSLPHFVRLQLLKDHGGLDAVAAAEAGTVGCGGGDGMEPVALGGLGVDDAFQLIQIPGGGADEFLLQSDLQNNILGHDKSSFQNDYRQSGDVIIIPFSARICKQNMKKGREIISRPLWHIHPRGPLEPCRGLFLALAAED